MPLALIENFRGGLDDRRMIDTAAPGTLISLTNAHLTRGGEIEKRKAYVDQGLDLSGSFGLGVSGKQLYVFGSGAAPVGFPYTLGNGTTVNYQQLVHESAANMTGVLDVTSFDGLMYVIATFDDGSTRHFYDGTIISHWYDGATGNPVAIGTFAMPYKAKVYSPADGFLYFSNLNEPANWTDDGDDPADPSIGAGSIGFSRQTEGIEDITGVVPYMDLMAIFGTDAIQLWSIDVDADFNFVSQTLTAAGTDAPNSIVAMSSDDVYYLDNRGIRSLRAKSSSNYASASSIGTAVDATILEHVNGQSAATVAASMAWQDPQDGRYTIQIGDRTFVYSQFPSSQISAWSEYSLGFSAEHVASIRQKLYVRSGDTLYLYGGTDGETYDSATVEVQTPFIALQDPSGHKTLKGLDIAAQGTWRVYVHPDPRDPSIFYEAGVFNGSTFSLQQIALKGVTSHVSIRCVNATSERAILGMLGVHFDAANRR